MILDIYISKFIVPKSFKRSCVTAKSFERFRISQYISKYFEIYFEIFHFRNILKIVSKYFESGFEIFFEIFCNRNNSKYFRTSWISWISWISWMRICNLGHAKNALDYIFEIVQNFVLCIKINLQILYYKIKSDLCL